MYILSSIRRPIINKYNTITAKNMVHPIWLTEISDFVEYLTGNCSEGLNRALGKPARKRTDARKPLISTLQKIYQIKRQVE